MSIFVRDKAFYRNLGLIAVPIAAQNLINFGINMADTVMLGMVGEVELSAASIANQLGFVYLLLIFGLGSGSGVMIAQYWGKGEVPPIHKVMTMMYRLTAVSAVLFITVALLFPLNIMAIFTQDQAVIAAGAEYLRIVAFSYILAGFTTSTVFVLRSVGSVRVSVMVYLCSLITNIVLNYVLIFGKLGFPAMGVKGAAIATCIARLVELLIVILYMTKYEEKIRYSAQYLFQKKLHFLKQYLHTALPVVFNEVLWGTGTATVAIIIGRMGTQFVAANAICTVLSQFVTVAIFGVGHAAATIIGNAVGAGQYDEVKEYAKTFMALAVLLGIVGSVCVLLLKDPVVNLYNISPLAKTYARQIINVYAIVVIFQSFALVSLIGVLRGGGDTRYVLVVDIIFLWAVSVPLGFFTGLYLHWPVPAVYAVIKSDDFIKSVFAFFRVSKMEWIHDVTKNQVK